MKVSNDLKDEREEVDGGVSSDENLYNNADCNSIKKGLLKIDVILMKVFFYSFWILLVFLNIKVALVAIFVWSKDFELIV